MILRIFKTNDFREKFLITKLFRIKFTDPSLSQFWSETALKKRKVYGSSYAFGNNNYIFVSSQRGCKLEIISNL